MEDKGILKKKKMVIFMIFTPPHYLSRVKGYSPLLLCEAPKWAVANGSFSFSILRAASLKAKHARVNWENER